MNIWDILVPAVTGSVAGFIAFVAGKRKSNAEADGVIVNNAEKVVKLYSGLSERDERRILALEKHLKDQGNEIKDLKRQYNELHKRYESERSQNSILQQKYNDLTNQLKGNDNTDI